MITTKVNQCVLKSICFVLVMSGIMLISCNESSSSKSKNESTVAARPVKTQAQIDEENRQFMKNREQVERKVKTKIEKLGYKAVSPSQITMYQDVANTHTPVKKVKYNFRYDEKTETITNLSTVEDKVFVLDIRFKKYSEYEITNVRLVDEGNMVYWDLE